MTNEDIIKSTQLNLTTYILRMNDCIKEKNYVMALANLNVCYIYLLNLKYIQEQEEFDNASIK